MISGCSWGSNKKCLLRIYCSHIRSLLNYGCILYASASQRILSQLNTIQNEALRIAIGAFCISPVLSLHAESNFIPLQHHRNLQILKYYCKTLAIPGHINSYRMRLSTVIPGVSNIAQQLLEKYQITLEKPLSLGALRLQFSQLRFSIQDFLQQEWNRASTNFLRSLKPTLEDWSTSYLPNRQEERVLARIRIGHTLLTHCHLLQQSEPPLCDVCHTKIDVLHVLNFYRTQILWSLPISSL